MARIKHPHPQLGTVKDRLGGVIFRDGFAEVDLSDKPNLRDAYAQHGYTVIKQVDETPFFDLTVAELLKLAKSKGIDIPKGARKADIVGAFVSAGVESD